MSDLAHFPGLPALFTLPNISIFIPKLFIYTITYIYIIHIYTYIYLYISHIYIYHTRSFIPLTRVSIS